jgi:hypothetical protein
VCYKILFCGTLNDLSTLHLFFNTINVVNEWLSLDKLAVITYCFLPHRVKTICSLTERTATYQTENTRTWRSRLRKLGSGLLNSLAGLTEQLMMEAVRTSETSVDKYFTRQYIPEDNSEHDIRRREKLKSHTAAALLQIRTGMELYLKDQNLFSAQQYYRWKFHFTHSLRYSVRGLHVTGKSCLCLSIHHIFQLRDRVDIY